MIDQEKAREVARRDVLRAFGLKDCTVTGVHDTEAPHVFEVDLDNGRREIAFVIGGRVATRPGLGAVGRYLREVEFLKRQNLSFEVLSSIVEGFSGELPKGVPVLACKSTGPEDEPASLVFENGRAIATWFYTLPLAGVLGNTPPRIVRAALHIRRWLRPKWVLEVRSKMPGSRWGRYRG